MMNLPAALQTLNMKVVTTFYRRLVVFSRSFNALPDLKATIDVSSRLLTAHDVDAYGAFHPHDSRSTFLARLGAGFYCTAVFYGDHIVHTGWVSTGPCPLPYLHCTLVPPSSSIYQFSGYTAPTFRNLGIARVRLLFNMRHFQAQGFSQSTGVVATENKPGLATYKALGHRPIGLFGCWQFGPLRRHSQESWTDDPLPLLYPKAEGAKQKPV